MLFYYMIEACEAEKQLGCCMEMKPVTYGDCIIPIIAISHSVSIFTHAHMGAHAAYCTLYTLTSFQIHMQTHTHGDKLFSAAVRCALLRCMPCDAHSAYLLYTAQWTFKLCPTRTLTHSQLTLYHDY